MEIIPRTLKSDELVYDKQINEGLSVDDLKEEFLQRFKAQQHQSRVLFKENAPEIAREVIELLKKQQELTYKEAYAVLELVYQQLVFESNFKAISQ